MLIVAGMLDMIGLILLCLSWLGVDDYGILDIIGGVIIGSWLLLKGGGSLEAIKKGAKKSAKRFGIAFLVEAIPFLGGIAPSWIVLVYTELKKG